ncbi:hypothetical protein [Desmospora profundinema]
MLVLDTSFFFSSDLEAAMRMIEGTAHNMGIAVYD